MDINGAILEIDSAINRLKSGKYKLHIAVADSTKKNTRDMHFHNTPEFFYQIGGATRFYTPAKDFTLHKGEFCIIDSKVYHTERTIGSKDFLNIVASMVSTLIIHLSSDKAGRPCVCSDYFPAQTPGVSIRNYLKDIILCQDNKNICDGLLLSFLAFCKNGLQIQSQKKRNSKVERVVHIVQAEFYDSTLSVAQIARRINCNPDYLSQLFSRETGGSLGKFITKTRLEFARQLIVANELSFSEIAWASGYRDPSYFSRIFKKTEGISLKEFRDRNLCHLV